MNGQRFPQLIVAAVVLAAALVASALVVTDTWDKQRSSVTVTGAATKELRSDLAVWRLNLTRRSPDRAEALAGVKRDLEMVRQFLQARGIPEDQISLLPVSLNVIYQVDQFGRETGQIQAYQANQTVEVKSADVDRITEAYKSTGELVEKGVELFVEPPQYFYTRLDELKLEMLAQATENARQRAERIAQKAGGRLGSLRSAKMGVFQITPVHSTEVSDYGINDTSSLEKKITAVVNVQFNLE
ncbi:MAG: SIMPL domain-containing protein [Clostridia bacterium]|nr:SIMPL domain-containing protein [Clostridia bacterium]